MKSFDTPPAFQDFPEPTGAGPVVTVRAAAISPIVKRLAAGGASTGFVPGVDGIGIDGTGRRVYFLFPTAPFGSLAEKSIAATTAPVPDDLADERAAAVATAGLASWVAYSRRAGLQPGETVLVLGATGAAGGLALQTARHFGAGTVIAAGRDEAKLASLDADATIALNEDADATLRERFAQGVDVVLDFVWGEPAVRVLRAASGSGSRVRYVQLGNDAGAEIPLRGDLLRRTDVRLVGSGLGSVSVGELATAAGELLAATPRAGFDTPFTTAPLRSVAEVWNDASTRYVLTPGA